MAATHVELKTYIDVLSQFIASSRRLRLQEIARSRCDKVAVLLENVLDTGNENAIARTMEGLGFHRLYRLRNDPKLYYPRSRMNKLQRTDAGARKWLIKHTTEDVDECIRSIRRENYQLACAIPTAVNSIFDVTVEKKTAFVFGNESNGVSQRLCDESDVKFSLPMSGFVESYNVSVAAAITLFHAHTQLKKRQVSKDGA